MGCCSSVKHSEEEEIINFFNKLYKENILNLNIKNYQENYNKISKLSGNNFKKLSKKQNVCVCFVKLLKKQENNIINSKYIDDEIQKILFRLIIFTLLLEEKIKEDLIFNDNNNIVKNNLINFKRDLLSYGFDIFNIQFTDLNTNKMIIYYLAKMSYLCFKDFIDASNYVSIKILINKIQLIIDSSCLDDEEESYIFIRDNILSLSQFFHYNKSFILSEEDLVDILIDLYSTIFYYYIDYFINNFSIIKESINKNMRNAINKYMVSNTENILPNIKQTFDIINSDNINNNAKNDFQDIKDVILIIDSIYYFFKVSIQDISSGKNILNLFGIKLVEKNKDNKDNIKFYDIILLILFYEFCSKEDEKLTLCLLDFIGELFFSKNSTIQIFTNNIYYDITLNSYYLTHKNETFNKQYILLLRLIFTKEIESNNKNLLLNQLIQIYSKKEKTINKLIKLFFDFLLNISYYYKEKSNIINHYNNNNDDNKKNVLLPLTNIIKTHFINKYSSGFSPINNENNYINCSTNYNTYNLYNGGKNHIKLEISDYELMIKNYFNFNSIKEENLYVVEFYFCLHLFIINNMDVKELIDDVLKRKKILNDLFKIITELEILLVKNSKKENNIINDGKEDNIKYILINHIIMAIQIILIILEINDKSYIQDCFILYKSLQNNVQLLLQIDSKNNDNEVYIFNLKIIYSIIFFILSQFIRLINIPNSINKNNIEILNCINQYNEKSGKYLSDINVPNFIIAKESIEANFQYLKELLLSKDKENDSNFINYNTFKQILDIIYSKLFGKESSLNIFFDNQIPNSNIYSNVKENSYDRSVSKLSDNITEPKDNSVINNYANNCNENFIDDISIHIIEQKNKMKSNSNEIGNLYPNQDSDINIPGNYNISDRMSSNTFTNDENPCKNIKI